MNDRNKFIIAFCMLLIELCLIILILNKKVFAAPEYSNHMNLTLSNGQTYDVYFSNTLAEKSFSLDKDSGIPLNYTNGNITGYILNSDGSTRATLQFPSFGQTLIYRVQGSSFSTTGLRITKMNSYSGIVFYGHKDSFYWIPVFAVFLVFILLFVRRKS